MNYKKNMLLGLFLLSTQVYSQEESELSSMRAIETVAQACNLQDHQEVLTTAEDRCQNATISTQNGPAPYREWTILLYIQARNNLAPFAIQNLRALTNVGSSPNVNFIIQWEQPGQKGVFRYALEGHQIIEKYRNLEENNICKPVDRITNAFRWTIQHFPSEKVGVFFWNHGLGAIDPIWGNPLRFLTYAYHPQGSQKATINSITHVSNDHHRACSFDEEARVYLSTTELIKVAHNMKMILKRKLEIIAFDACFMSCFCIWYLLQEFAKIGVGSSDIELATGWHYAAIMQYFANKAAEAIKLNRPRPITETDLSGAITETYGQFYNGRTHIYTLSAINLSAMEDIKKNIDYIAHKLHAYMDIFGDRFKQVIIKARKATLEFANPMFADIRSFYIELHKQLSSTPICRANGLRLENPTLHQAPGLYDETRDPDEIKNFKRNILEGIKLMEKAVISHVSSPHLSRSSGFGIYFPCRDFYASYCTGVFSKVSIWPDFINKFFTMIQEREYAQML